jgi:hypothetical protein
MNIAFYIILVFLLVALWFMLSFIFPVIGKFLLRIFKDTVDIIKGDDSQEDD